MEVEEVALWLADYHRGKANIYEGSALGALLASIASAARGDLAAALASLVAAAALYYLAWLEEAEALNTLEEVVESRGVYNGRV